MVDYINKTAHFPAFNENNAADFAVTKFNSLRFSGRTEKAMAWPESRRFSAQIKEAIAYAQTWLKDENNIPNADFWDRLGGAYSELKEYDQSLLCCDRALIIDDCNADIASHKMLSLICLGQLEEAIIFAQQWLKVEGHIPNHNFCDFLKTWRFGENPTGVFYAYVYYHQTSEYNVEKSSSLNEQAKSLYKQVKMILDDLDNQKVLEDNNGEVAAKRIRELYNSPSQDIKAAITLGENWLKVEDRIANASVWNQLGLAYRKLKQYDQAIACFEQALALDDSNIDIAFNKRISLDESGHKQEAQEFADSWCKLHQVSLAVLIFHPISELIMPGYGEEPRMAW